MSTKTQSKSKGTNPLFIGLGALFVIVIAVVLFFVLGGSSGNLCSTGTRNELYLYDTDEGYQVDNAKIISAADEAGVPVSPQGVFSNNVTSGELKSVLEIIVKKEGKNVYGLAVSTPQDTVLGFGKGSGSLDLAKIPDDLFPRPRDPESGDFSLVFGNVAAAATYTSEKCPTEAVNLAGGKAPPVVQFPSGGTQAPTGTPAP